MNQWKYCYVGYLKFSRLFSSRTFMVSWLIFKSFIHLVFILVYGVSWWSSFIFSHVLVHISQYYLLKKLFLLLPSLSNINWPYWHGFISGLYSNVPLTHVSVLMPVPDCLDHGGLVIQFDIRYCDPSNFVLHSQDYWGYLGSFWFHVNFWNICSRSLKYAIGI